MLDKKQAAKITKWAGQQNELMKYGQFANAPLTKEELKKLLSERDEDFFDKVIPSPCVICMIPNNTENKFYPEFWLQVKGWYGTDKDWVRFSPNNESETKTFLQIAKKNISSINEELNYFDY